MEILFISHKYPPAVGGMEKQSFELITGMGKFTTVHSIVYTGQESRLRFFLSLERRILHMCRKFPGISVIHFNDALVATACLHHKSYGHLFRAVTVHGLDIVFPNRIYQTRIIPAFNRFDLIIAVSNATAQACLERGIDAGKVTVIANGVDHLLRDTEPDAAFVPSFEKKYGLRLQDKVVLTVIGRPVKRKGFSWFIENVYPKLQGNFTLLLIGSFNPERTWTDKILSAFPGRLRTQLELAMGYPTDENAIRMLLSKQKSNGKIVHLHKLPLDEMIQVLKRTNALLMPNITVPGDMEGFGLVGLEASICGSWVFAAGIDGITDAIHHEQNGTLIAAGNAVLWADTLNDFIKNPHLFHKDPTGASQYTMTRFGWEKMVSMYFELFKQRAS